MTTNTFHFTRNPQGGRPVVGSKLFAAGQRQDASSLETVKQMAATDQAAQKTEEVLETLERYSASLRFYDGHPKDFHAEPGKVAVSQGVVRGASSTWSYHADAAMEFDPVSQEIWSLDAEVQNSPRERFQLSTGDDGMKKLCYSTSRGDSYTFAIDNKNGTITTIIEAP